MQPKYIEVTQKLASCGARPDVTYRLVYEVTPYRDGQVKTFLIHSEIVPEVN